MKLYALIENTSNIQGMESEHGLSLYFEADGLKFIVDTGQSEKFITNARKIDIEPNEADAVIISHNHYDHIGGLKALLTQNNKARVFIRKAAFGRDYMRLSVSKKQLSYSEKEFGEHRERFVLTDYITKLTQSVSLISVPRPDVRYICKDSELYMSSGSGYTKDDFSHEQSVIIRSEGGVNIISPCSHTGIINIINRARELTGEKILNVVGGLHMQGRGGKNEINCDRAFIEETAAYLFKNVNGKVYTGHCTGIAAYEILKSIMGDKIEYLSTGNTIEI